MFAVSSAKFLHQLCNNALCVRPYVQNNSIFSFHLRKFNTKSKWMEKSRYMFLQELKSDGRQYISYSYKTNVKKLKYSIHKHSMLILQHCYKQMEFILAHRLRRCQQILLLYSKWWDELRLKLFIQQIRNFLPANKNKLFLSTSIVSCLNYNNDSNIDTTLIQDSEFGRYSDEINRVYALKGIPPKNNTSDRNKIKPISHVPTKNQRPNVLCKCSRCRHGTSVEGWVEIYNKDNLTFWKKEHLDHKGKGLYCYKVYGYFTDITAEDFLQVQINVDFRKEWDQTAIELKILDQDPKTQTDIVYWELRFPRFFTNRDYVFLRRCNVDDEKKVITIINQSTNHSSCPPKAGKHRVHEFWSYMVIKPTTDFDKPGLEFVITYFDNPGIRMPAYISSWLTFTEMPDFISRQRKAALLWSKRKQPSPNTFPKDSNSSPRTEINNSIAFPASLPTSTNPIGNTNKHNTPLTPSSTPSYYQIVKNSIFYMFYSN